MSPWLSTHLAMLRDRHVNTRAAFCIDELDCLWHGVGIFAVVIHGFEAQTSPHQGAGLADVFPASSLQICECRAFLTLIAPSHGTLCVRKKVILPWRKLKSAFLHKTGPSGLRKRCYAEESYGIQRSGILRRSIARRQSLAMGSEIRRWQNENRRNTGKSCGGNQAG